MIVLQTVKGCACEALPSRRAIGASSRRISRLSLSLSGLFSLFKTCFVSRKAILLAASNSGVASIFACKCAHKSTQCPVATLCSTSVERHHNVLCDTPEPGGERAPGGRCRCAICQCSSEG